MENKVVKDNRQLTLDFTGSNNQNYSKKEVKIISFSDYSSKKNNISKEILKNTKSW